MVAATKGRLWGQVGGWICRDPSISAPVEVKLEGMGELWQVPFFTFSQSERGFDRIYQGTGFLVVARGEERLSFSLALRQEEVRDA